MPNIPKKVLIAMADGTEEIEAVTVIDVLRRAGIEVTVASVMPHLLIKASRGVQLQAECLIETCVTTDWDMIVLPGGLPGAQHLSDATALIQLLQQQLHNQRWVAAICAAPAVILARHQLIDGYVITGYPSTHQTLRQQGLIVSSDAVVVDRHLITSQGPGTAMAFALSCVKLLLNQEKATAIAEGMVFN